MHPILFRIPFLDLPINGFGLMVAIGVLVALWQLDRYGRELGLDRDKVSSVITWTIVGLFLGARALYFGIHPDELLKNGVGGAPLQFVALWNGGLVFYGGLVGGVAVGMWRVRSLGLPLPVMFDVVLTCAFLAQIFGRWGCFLAGCDYGAQVKVDDPAHAPWWLMHTPDPLPERSNLPAPGVYLLPTQPLMSLKAVIVHVLGRVTLKRQRVWGVATCVMLIAYAILRSIVEVYRGDWEARGFTTIAGLRLSTSQIVSIPAVILAVVMLVWLARRRGDRPVFAAQAAEAQAHRDAADRAVAGQTPSGR